MTDTHDLGSRLEDRYLEPDLETIDRADLERLQEDKLLDLLPYVYERSPLIRATWDAHGVHPRDVRTLDDFRERVPFIDKDAIRRFRDDHGDPYGGLLCLPEDELTGVMSTSGTTGDPTPVPERWGASEDDRFPALAREFWEIGVRPGDHVTWTLFTFRGPAYATVQSIGGIPLFLDHDPREAARFVDLALAYRPTAGYSLSNVLITGFAAVEEALDLDLREVFASFHGAVFGGEPLGPRARGLVERWGLELFEHTSLGDVGAATECREHDGCHFQEDTAFVEHLEVDGDEPVPDGARGELVVTALDNRVAPLVRYRSNDILELTRERCGCGRTHGRLWPLGRTGDELLVEGRSVLPRDVWEAVESVPECRMGLFQLLRPAREVDHLELRVGHDGSAADLDELADRVAEAVEDALGVAARIQLVPEEQLLRLGPPHKIPRVAKA